MLQTPPTTHWFAQRETHESRPQICTDFHVNLWSRNNLMVVVRKTDRLRLTRKRTRSDCDSSLQLKRAVNSSSLDAYKSSFLGQIKNIWSEIPHPLIDEGSKRGWCKVKKRVVNFFSGKWGPGKGRYNKKIKPKPHNMGLNQELNKQTDWDLGSVRKAPNNLFTI